MPLRLPLARVLDSSRSDSPRPNTAILLLESRRRSRWRAHVPDIAAVTARTVMTTPMAMKDRPKEPPARPGLHVFVKVLLHRGERIEPRDPRIPPPVVSDVDPGDSPRRDELKHAQPDAREAEDQASDQLDHTVLIGGRKRSLQPSHAPPQAESLCRLSADSDTPAPTADDRAKPAN